MDNIKLFNADCLEEMKNIEDKSINLIFVDLPYGETACKWDCLIDLELMWKEFKRIRLDTTPIVLTCSTKFGYSLIESNKKEFRYDMIWIKGDSGYSCEKCNYKKDPKIAKTGFLNSKRLPLKSHEMVYIFYKKSPSEVYGNNIKKYHKHKYLDEEKHKSNNENENKVYGNLKYRGRPAKLYEPVLPTSIIKEDNGEVYGKLDYRTNPNQYEKPLPNTILEIKKEKKFHPTQKPTGLSDFFIKYYSNECDTILDNCMGSGSTCISCINLNRKFIGIEKDKDIFNIAKNRIEKELEKKK